MKRRDYGEGTIRKRKNGGYEARYRVGKDIDGKYIQKSIYGSTPEEVKEKLKKVLAEMTLGTYTEQTNMTLQEWLKIWLEEYKKDSIKPSSYQRYMVCVHTHIAPKIGHIKLKELRPDTLQQFINTKFKTGYSKKEKGRKDKSLSARSVEYIYITIHSALSQAVKNNLLIRNVADAVKLPRVTKKDITVLTPEEQQVFLDAIKGHKYEIAFKIGLMTGMRIGEVLALNWDDVDFKKCTIRVNKNIQRIITGARSEVVIQKSPKTLSSNRVIPILEPLLIALEQHKQTQIKHIKNNFVVSSEEGNFVEPRKLTRYFDKVIKDAKIRKIGFHALRHTFATRALENSMNPKVVQEILGHSSITMTLDLYSHVLPDTKKSEMNKLKNCF